MIYIIIYEIYILDIHVKYVDKTRGNFRFFSIQKSKWPLLQLLHKYPHLGCLSKQSDLQWHLAMFL